MMPASTTCARLWRSTSMTSRSKPRGPANLRLRSNLPQKPESFFSFIPAFLLLPFPHISSTVVCTSAAATLLAWKCISRMTKRRKDTKTDSLPLQQSLEGFLNHAAVFSFSFRAVKSPENQSPLHPFRWVFYLVFLLMFLSFQTTYLNKATFLFPYFFVAVSESPQYLPFSLLVLKLVEATPHKKMKRESFAK